MDRFERAERGLARALEGVVSAAFLVLAVLVVALVVLRYIFNTTIIGGNEITGYLFIYTTALGAAVSVGTGQHIRIGVVVDALPRRAALLVDGLAILLIAVLHLGLLWYSLEWIASVGGFPFAVVRIPQGVIQVAVPIGCGFVVLFCLTRLAAVARAWRALGAGGRP